MTLVDSNVIIDILTQDPRWAAWSEAALARVADSDEVAINPIIYAELATGFARVADLDASLGAAAFRRLVLPYEAGFIAGHAFVEYRRRGGARTSPLPDFYIGAHAAVAGLMAHSVRMCCAASLNPPGAGRSCGCARPY